MYEIVSFVKIPRNSQKTIINKIEVGGIFVFPEVRSYVIQNVCVFVCLETGCMPQWIRGGGAKTKCLFHHRA